MPETIHLKAQETATIYRRNLSSLPIDIYFDAVALDGEPLQGVVAVQGSYWVFPKPPLMQPLQAQNQVHAGFWDTFFSIQVTAHTPIAITFPKPKLNQRRWLVWAIAATLVAAVAATLFVLTG